MKLQRKCLGIAFKTSCTLPTRPPTLFRSYCCFVSVLLTKTCILCKKKLNLSPNICNLNIVIRVSFSPLHFRPIPSRFHTCVPCSVPSDVKKSRNHLTLHTFPTVPQCTSHCNCFAVPVTFNR